MEEMMFALKAFFVVLMSPAIILFVYWFWMVLVPSLLLFPEEENDPPYCDIDPLCHPSFVWTREGKGVIRNIDTGLRSRILQ